MRRFLPRSLRGQVLAVVAVALALAQAVGLWLFADERGLAVRAALAREALDRAARVVTLLEAASYGEETAILAAASSPLVRFDVNSTPALDYTGHSPAAIGADLAAGLGVGREVRLELHETMGVMAPMAGMPQSMQAMHSGMAVSAVELQLSAGLKDGRWLNVTTRFHRPPLQWAPVDVVTFLISAAFLAVAVWLVLGRITRPVARLSRAADQLGRGDWVAEIPSNGPQELVQLTNAFNRMQARLRRFVDERANLLAALGHDLRSPLTALRVRAEMVDDDETRTKLIVSVDEMQEMVEATLTFARGTASAETVAEVNLSDFLRALVADYADTGRDVAIRPPDPPDQTVHLRPGTLRRALRNLVDNALRYGAKARLSVEVAPQEFRIHVDDNGPGIPEADLARVFEPFVRLETSRSRETGGTGLGLAIARAIARAQGGEVTLTNRAEGGLCATLNLPRVMPGTVRQK